MLTEPQASTPSLAPFPASRSAAVGHASPAQPDVVPDGWTAAAGRLLQAVFLIVVLQTLFSAPRLAWDLAFPGREGLGAALSAAIALAAAALLWAGRNRVAFQLGAAGERLAGVPGRRWLAMAIALGIALRLAWALLFPAQPTSDGLAYYDLAARLAQGLTYQAPGGEHANWPPGYPFLLLIHFKLLGIGLPAVVVSNLLLFVGTLLAVYALARRFGEGTARLATLFLAVWPNLVMLGGIAGKEGVIVFLLPVILLLYLRAGERERRSPWRARGMTLTVGLVLGYATLTQPALQLLVAVFLAYEVLRRSPVLEAGVRLALILCGMALVILPWTLRNQRVLGEPVLISTNGGSVFYRANNPLATGGFIRDGERSLRGYDELTQDRLGYRWGKEWIRENPGDFLRLALKKQILFLGDDSMGAYDTLKRGRGEGGALYAAAKLLSNAWWWGIWALTLAVLLAQGKTLWHRRADVVLILLTVLYFWAIDSVFESGSRHHLPLLGLLAVLAAAGGTGRERGDSPI